MGEQDLFTWNYSKTGSFSVHSAYHLAVSLEDSPCSSSHAALESAWWRKVWQVRIPNKVKVFVWRACQNALPTGANLHKRASISQVVCPLCGDDFEDVIHVLLCCPFARQVWGMVPLAANIRDCAKTRVLLRMQSVASQVDAKPFGLFTCVCWGIWWLRNRCAMVGTDTGSHICNSVSRFFPSPSCRLPIAA
ncbi:UNVERIFIED_CONTAM: putative ribonuclease H protein [Sesamum radiatum]|uniref:Ribonuclease H protein n=1 Tax=Sesamum radiatum TaxID=300843 RepID=A0AAW2V287_SESRA